MVLQATYGDKRKYRFGKIAEFTARTARLEHQKFGTVTVEEYFKKMGISLAWPHMPLIQFGNPEKPTQIPMELLQVSDKLQRLRMKLPDELQVG